MRKLVYALSLSLGLASPASAINWAEGQVADPFSDQQCNVQMIVSYGGYIYQYPSKWDGVYFPNTDRNWLWACPSGFVALGSDEFFNQEEVGDSIDERERSNIRSFLVDNPKLVPNWKSRWERFIELEALRNRPAARREFIFRLRAYFAEDVEIANEYRAQAAQLIEGLMASGEISGIGLIERQFLMGVYAERKGNQSEADKWFVLAKETLWIDDDDAEHEGLAYFNELIAEVIESREQQNPPWNERVE
ncbi:MAG: hypothetical protein AAFY34_07085 [Pseudomonadota bacterium]